MLNSETRHKIDSLRDLLVGMMPSPQWQVEQITLALIYKFMSDIDDEASGIFKNASFFPEWFEQYKWTNIMNAKLSAWERLNLYAEWLEKMNNNPKIPALFRQIFKHAFLPFRNPTVLDRFLKQINEFEYEHSEDLWDAFEYLLSCLSSAWDAWMFRTPRHIIDFIVQVVEPELTDKILDPACWTAWFLVSAYKYLVHKYPTKKKELAKLSENIQWYDISHNMVQLALVNLYLHQFPDPKIHEYDTLSSEDRRWEKFDCILANPPFMTPKWGIVPHNKFSIQSNRSEVLFVDYIMEHLKSTGKAWIIVPEWVIFQSANAYKQLRKLLIEQWGLWWVVSLPVWVFNPYSWVKTSILLLDKNIQTDKIIFAKITGDWYDLWAQRREVTKNDIPTVLEWLLKAKDGIINHKKLEWQNLSDLIWSVSKANMAEDFNLSSERYRAVDPTHTGNWDMVKLEDICEVQNWFAFDSKLFSEHEWYPLIRIRDINSWFWNTKYNGSYNDEYIVNNWDLLIGMDWDFKAKIRQDWNALLNQRTCRLRNFKWASQKYIFYLIQSELDKIHKNTFAVTVKHLSSKQILWIKVPLPPVVIQEQIVAELDSYQAIIEGAGQVISNWKPRIETNPEWKIVKLWEVCEFNPKKTEIANIDQSTIVSFLPMSDLWDNSPDFIVKTSKPLYEVYKGYTYFRENDVLLAKVTPCFENWKAGIAKNLVNSIWFWSSEYIVIRPNENILPMWIYCCIIWEDFRKWWKQSMTWTGWLQRVPNDYIKEFKIPLPPIPIQHKIIAQIQYEQGLVSNMMKLVNLYETKLKERIEAIWTS
jgi:type I restriction enzyme M protein